MALLHNEDSIHNGAVSQEVEYLVWHRITSRRVSIVALLHKEDSIHNGAVSQEEEYLVWHRITSRRVSMVAP